MKLIGKRRICVYREATIHSTLRLMFCLIFWYNPSLAGFTQELFETQNYLSYRKFLCYRATYANHFSFLLNTHTATFKFLYKECQKPASQLEIKNIIKQNNKYW
ncbi:hypothetical protein LX32DRAFT_280133 [Colletotrichum zoysiae]|uniref:Uncharacterized protein n=1 Tax=Colletotrichum zoysiae TaxID=1216348 RepID=A0AAD9HN63_9PEZI|nr:hypothetical protein LX32DRAFT_280133 [Colletotrichum zoysiae]